MLQPSFAVLSTLELALPSSTDPIIPFFPPTPSPSSIHLRFVMQAELKILVASVVSRLHVTLDAQRMGHLRTVEDYIGETCTRLTLQRFSPCWLRMAPRVCL